MPPVRFSLPLLLRRFRPAWKCPRTFRMRFTGFVTIAGDRRSFLGGIGGQDPTTKTF